MLDVGAALRYARSNHARFIEELSALVRMPSVSSDPGSAPHVERCARWLANHLRRIGFPNARLVRAGGPPIVVAERRGKTGDRPTLLVYGHYDVQPADPIGAWQSPPFEPVVRKGALYGRGASDDKGQFFAHLKALESWIAGAGELPVHVRVILEGEEEVGSNALRAWIVKHRDTLRSTAALLSDMVMRGPGQPTLNYAVRGQVAMEIELAGQDRDLHSGQFGGAVHDPAQAMAELLASMHEPSGRVAIDGFYDTVRTPSRRERRYMTRVAPRDAEILTAAGATVGWGEPGFTLYERSTARPALTINGIASGYAGAGSKAVIPSRAVAKLSVRTVEGQDPQRVVQQVKRHVRRVLRPTMRARVTTTMAVPAATVETSHPVMRAARAACVRGFGREPVMLRLGGTIPVVSTLRSALGIPAIMLGLALPDDRLHAPNEHFELDNFFRGIDTSIWLLRLLANRAPGTS